MESNGDKKLNPLYREAEGDHELISLTHNVKLQKNAYIRIIIDL